MSRTRVAGIAAAMLAAGLIVGMAGTVIAHDETSAADCARVMVDHMDGSTIADHMTGGAMDDLGSMMGGASGMPGNQHQLHHPGPTPGAAR